MIRNGVIDAQKEFAQRRYYAEIGREFDVLKIRVLKERGVDIECCRETYCKAGKKLFAVVGDILVNAYENPPVIEDWEEHKRRNQG